MNGDNIISFNLMTNMTRENRTGAYNDEGTGGYKAGTLSEDYKQLRYCVQKIDAKGSDHPNVQSKSYLNDNYEAYSIIEIGTDNDAVFTKEELINIEGFITPTPPSEPESTFFLPYYNDK